MDNSMSSMFDYTSRYARSIDILEEWLENENDAETQEMCMQALEYNFNTLCETLLVTLSERKDEKEIQRVLENIKPKSLGGKGIYNE
jgi:hypothetical protein